MNSKFIKMLFLGSLALANAYDDFGEIPLVGSGNGPDGAVGDPNVIENSDKTITLELKRGQSYRDIMKEAVFKHHLRV